MSNTKKKVIIMSAYNDYNLVKDINEFINRKGVGHIIDIQYSSSYRGDGKSNYDTVLQE
jgi:hypothetical protein